MTFEEMLKRFSGKEVTCLMNRGNRGDGVIHDSGKLLFKRKGIKTTEISYPQKASGKALFVYGCGSFCTLYNDMIRNTLYYLDKFEEIYLLPTGFETSHKPVRDFLAKLPKKVYIFIRERYSYAQAIKILKYPENVSMHQDLAFYFDTSRWTKKGSSKLVSFRTDESFPEFISKELIDLNIDMSLGGSENNWKDFVEDISNYQEIHTNRAHVAITAAMLEKRTYVYPGAYHKLKGIYEYSLYKFKNVTWVEN